MRNYADFTGFLSAEGRGVYELLKKHITANGSWDESFAFELGMLANSFDLYAKNAEYCRENGIAQTFESGVEQVSPQYSVMKNEYGNILKHAPKFGLNPQDFSRIFGEVKKPEVKKGFDLRMRVAK